MGYACLYKAYGNAVDAIKEEDITITLIRDTHPNGLIQYFKGHGYQLANPYNGIYYITGKFPFPAQIIVIPASEKVYQIHWRSRAYTGNNPGKS